MKKGYFQQAEISNGSVKLLDGKISDGINFINDIIDEMIEINLKFGGDTVFLEGDELSDFQSIASTVRF
ncbi:MAG: hypothetical protein KIT33_11985 [Candidatus Kapabacteria bacterium]|nr:hypothetical protein [Ignavibacteriota bacterium]MCW5885679.1 hypothetical protein [Candidatus Kapabacteria bacterium]